MINQFSTAIMEADNPYSLRGFRPGDRVQRALYIEQGFTRSLEEMKASPMMIGTILSISTDARKNEGSPVVTVQWDLDTIGDLDVVSHQLRTYPIDNVDPCPVQVGDVVRGLHMGPARVTHVEEEDSKHIRLAVQYLKTDYEELDTIPTKSRNIHVVHPFPAMNKRVKFRSTGRTGKMVGIQMDGKYISRMEDNNEILTFLPTEAYRLFDEADINA